MRSLASSTEPTMSAIGSSEVASGGYRSPVRMLLEGLEGLLLLPLVVLSWPLSRFLLDNWGSSTEEVDREWPGDQLLGRIDRSWIRAVEVRAPRERVWPWLLQLGLSRGGFYSYEMLENLAGLGVRNLERIDAQLQSLELDQEIELVPGKASVWVSSTQPGKELCTRTWRDARDLAQHDPELKGTWSFYLEPSSPHSCRLFVRTCKQRLRRRALHRALAQQLIEDPLDFVMEQRLLRTVRRLSEKAPAEAR